MEFHLAAYSHVSVWTYPTKLNLLNGRIFANELHAFRMRLCPASIYCIFKCHPWYSARRPLGVSYNTATSEPRLLCLWMGCKFGPDVVLDCTRLDKLRSHAGYTSFFTIGTLFSSYYIGLWFLYCRDMACLAHLLLFVPTVSVLPYSSAIFLLQISGADGECFFYGALD